MPAVPKSLRPWLGPKSTNSEGTLEAVSKFRIAFKGKTQLDEKAEHIQSYVSILKKAATPPLDVRWDFETASD
jgi:hypothetical protein